MSTFKSLANIAGPRWSLTVAAASGIVVAVIGMVWIIRPRQLRLTFNRRARGLRYFRVVSQRTAAGINDDGAARVPHPDDADQP